MTRGRRVSTRTALTSGSTHLARARLAIYTSHACLHTPHRQVSMSTSHTCGEEQKVPEEKQGVNWALVREHHYIMLFCLIMAVIAMGNALLDVIFFDQHLYLPPEPCCAPRRVAHWYIRMRASLIRSQ